MEDESEPGVSHKGVSALKGAPGGELSLVFFAGGCLTLGKCRQEEGYNSHEIGSVLPLRSSSEALYIELSFSS